MTLPLAHNVSATGLPAYVTTGKLLEVAAGLLGDGHGNEWDVNPEYSRAVFEVLADALGLGGERDDRIALMRALLAMVAS